jgi:hypothetical protein
MFGGAFFTPVINKKRRFSGLTLFLHSSSVIQTGGLSEFLVFSLKNSIPSFFSGFDGLIHQQFSK